MKRSRYAHVACTSTSLPIALSAPVGVSAALKLWDEKERLELAKQQLASLAARLADLGGRIGVAR